MREFAYLSFDSEQLRNAAYSPNMIPAQVVAALFRLFEVAPGMRTVLGRFA